MFPRDFHAYEYITGCEQMITVLSCITVQHDIGLVLLAGTLCAFGMWVTARLYQYGKSRPSNRATPWHMLTAATAGVSIWCTHFVAMLGYRPDVPVDFDLSLTLISLLIAIAGSAFGLMFSVLWGGRTGPILGGAVLGLAISAMHYAGMIAYRVQGIVDWNIPFLIASIILAIFFSAAALHLGQKGGRSGELQMAGLLTTGIVCLHFTGMAAFEVSPLLISGDFVNPEALRMLAVAVAATAVFIVIGGFFSYAVESRLRLESIKELTAARNAAEDASRAKSEFMSVLSHELRTPLTVILGYASMLSSMKEMQARAAKKEGKDSPSQPDLAAAQAEIFGDKITHSAKHLLTMINEILDYTGIELNDAKLSRTVFPLRTLLEDVQKQFAAQAEEKGMTLSVACDDIDALADRQRFFQILDNITSNAITFSKGSKIELRGLKQAEGYVIEIEDDGCGIDSSEFDTIFEAFKQIETADHRAVGGTGLGLAICRKLSQAHGGDIRVASTLGKGTIFTVSLPASAMAPGSQQRADSRAPSGWRGVLRGDGSGGNGPLPA